MDLKEFVIDLYKRNYSIKYITRRVYNLLNKKYFTDFQKTKIINKNNYFNIDFCRNKVETIILDFISVSKEV